MISRPCHSDPIAIRDDSTLPGWLRSLCLNFVLGGNCHATGGKCTLGATGASVKNETLECELHGKYDVWVLQDDKLLVTDLGFPSEEPKQCLALGINQRLAARIAGREISTTWNTSTNDSTQMLSMRLPFLDKPTPRSFWSS